MPDERGTEFVFIGFCYIVKEIISKLNPILLSNDNVIIEKMSTFDQQNCK